MSDYTPKDVKVGITKVQGDVEVMRLGWRIRKGTTLYQKLGWWYTRLGDVASWPLDQYQRGGYIKEALHAIADIELQIMVTSPPVDKRGKE